MSADTEFHVNYRRVELRAPFLAVCATDGCFGYLPTPMHFEHLVLGCLLETRNTAAWSSAVQAKITAVTGDDAAMSTLGVGADFKEFQKLFSPRVAELASEFVEPVDVLSNAVIRVEHELEALRSRKLHEMTESWNRYKSGYERYLRPEALIGEDEAIGRNAVEPIHQDDNSEALETSTDDAALIHREIDSEESIQEELPEPIDDSARERNAGGSSA
jgi:hypothetical protein